jgi:hypothetical protein
MDLPLIAILIRLRYRLLWAQTRTRNGKIAFFFAGYLLLVMAISFLATKGLHAGIEAVRSGHGAILAGVLLTGVFVQATLASVILGFGMSVVFSDTELRRYPLRARERRLTRHCIGIVDPYWILFLALYFSVAAGVYWYGAGWLGCGLAAVLLLFACNYIGARVLAILVDRLTSRKFGSAVLLGGVILTGMAPAMLLPVLQKNPALLTRLLRIWERTPPAAAAVAMIRPGLSALTALGVILLWTAGLLALLVVLERWPLRAAVAPAGKIVWEDRMDRLAAVFGPRTGPLVAHWMRFYFRNNRFRTIYPLALPLAGFLLVYMSRQTHSNPFPNALGAFGILGFVGTGQFAVNQFGCVGGGFRRFLLLPTAPAAAFRAGSYLFVILSAVLILPAALLWAFFSPIPSNARSLAMLVGFSLASLFLFHGVALWTSLLGPRRGKYTQGFGNDLSLAGNVVVIGAMLSLLFGPPWLAGLQPALVSPESWWTTPLLALAAAGFYFASLRFTSTLFRSRREQLMALMEGRG